MFFYTSIYTEFSLARYSGTTVYANNSVININLVGEGFVRDHLTDGGALECHTDDTTCCRGIDDPSNVSTGTGEWYYPNGTVVSPPNSGNSVFRTRDHMVIRLNREDGVTQPTGVYTCVIPGAGGVTIIRYITLQCRCMHDGCEFIIISFSHFTISASDERCFDFPLINDGSILYVPPGSVLPNIPAGEHYIGTIATYRCSPGYQLVGGLARTCVPGGMWNGIEPTCGMLN